MANSLLDYLDLAHVKKSLRQFHHDNWLCVRDMKEEGEEFEEIDIGHIMGNYESKMYSSGMDSEKMCHSIDRKIPWSNFMNTEIIRQCTHVLVFTQTLKEHTLWCAYGYQRSPNSSLCVVNCLDENALESVTSTERCTSRHLHSASKLLNQCYGGCLFPFKLVDHAARSICATERVCLLRLSEDEKHTWLLMNDDQHWSFQLMESHLKQHENFHFDNCYVYTEFDYENFLKTWQLKYDKQKTTKSSSHMKVLKSCPSQSPHPNIKGYITIRSSLTNSTYGIRIGKSVLGEVEVSLNPTWCQDDFKNDQGAFLSTCLQKRLSVIYLITH